MQGFSIEGVSLGPVLPGRNSKLCITLYWIWSYENWMDGCFLQHRDPHLASVNSVILRVLQNSDFWRAPFCKVCIEAHDFNALSESPDRFMNLIVLNHDVNLGCIRGSYVQPNK